MHALALLIMNQHANFEMPSFTHSKHMIEAQNFKNELRDIDHAHYVAVCHPKPNTCAPNFTTLSPAVPDISLGPKH